MSDFRPFALAVHARFVELSKHELFTTNTGDLAHVYLAAFPVGTNPIYRTNTEHDCSCCKNFLRNLGSVVAIVDGKLQSIWDVPGLESPYKEVAATLNTHVLNSPLVSIYRSKEPSYGAISTVEALPNGDTHRWNHFYGTVAKRHFTSTPEKARGEFNGCKQVFHRGLEELTPSAVQQVLDLIEANALYRGEEHKRAVASFKEMQDKFLQLDGQGSDLFVFANAENPVGRLRNTAIGTLVQDLSNSMPLEAAVRKFEAMVAPANYKRPTALITPRMVTDAMKTIGDLGLEPALQRRLATIADVSVNNVLWVDNSAKNLMRSPLEGVLMQVAEKTKAKASAALADTAEDVTIADFLVNVLPGATGIELLVKNHHRGNFMTLTAPVDPASPDLFKWANGFGWSYSGNIADSDIRAAVQARGGRVDGVFRFSHSWNHVKRNASLMDLHVFMPGSTVAVISGVDDKYGNNSRVGWNHRQHISSGGSQDVDYTSEAPAGYVPVENITFPSLGKMPEGRYICKVHNWHARSPNEGGFKAEIEFGGQLFEYDHPKPLSNKQWVTVAEVNLKDGKFAITHHLSHGASSAEVWGVNTETFVKVNTILPSPNHWDDQAVGNKHWFFILEGCRTSDPARGIYNEFLRSDLEVHRKVFEVLGDKTKCPVTDNQLSGLGFSSTRNDTVTVAVKSARGTRRFNVTF